MERFTKRGHKVWAHKQLALPLEYSFCDDYTSEVAPESGVTTDHSLGFEEFFEKEHRMLFGTLCLVTGDRHEADEIAQDAFVKIWDRRDRVRGHPDPRSYLYRTAFNVHRSRYRRSLTAAKHLVGPSQASDVFAEVDARETLATAMRLLSPRQRAAITLTELIGLTSTEAAEVLGIAPSTVRVLASKARAGLRLDLEKADE